jgi:hypothetical protein
MFKRKKYSSWCFLSLFKHGIKSEYLWEHTGELQDSLHLSAVYGCYFLTRAI